jgi:hypothetical protein
MSESFVVVGGAFALALACAEPREETSTGVPTGGGPGSGSDTGESGASSEEDSNGDAPRLDVAPGGTMGDDPDGDPMCEEDVDIVFVMDVSTSMGPFLSTLADEILVVDQALASLGLPNPPHYGLVVFVDDVALLGGGAPYPDVQTLQADFQMWSTFTASNQQVGGGNQNTTWPENSLDGLHAAAAGFQWRQDAARIVIHTTDDTFWEGPSTQNGVMIQHDYAGTVDALQSREIRVFSFTAQIGGMCECEDVTPGWSAPYLGMPPVFEATDGGVFDIDLVLAGQVSLADAINDAVETSMCDPYDPVG